MRLTLRPCAPLLVLLAGTLLLTASPSSASITFGFNAADSARQYYLYDPGENYDDVSFTLLGGSGNTALTLGAAKTIHLGKSELYGETDEGGGVSFDNEPLPHTFSLTGTAGTVTYTLPQTDTLNAESSGYQSVDIAAGPAVTFDMGTQGRVDVTPQEYVYDNTSGGAAPKFAYTLLLRPAAIVPSGVTVSPTSVTYPASAMGTVTLAKAAADTEIVALISSNPAAASIPATVTLTAGQQTAAFPIATYKVDTNTAVTFSASAGGTTKSTTFTVETRPETAFTYNLPGISSTTYTDPTDSGNQLYFGLSGGSGTVKLAQGFPLTLTTGQYSHDASLDSDQLQTSYSIENVPLSTACTIGLAGNTVTQSFSQSLSEGASDDEDDDFYFDSSVTNSQTLVYDFGPKGRLQVTSYGYNYSFDNGGSQGFSGTTPATYTFLLSPPNTPASLLVSPGKVYGGATTYGKVTLATAAGTGGQTVVLQSSDPAAASVPDTIVVPAGVKSAVFPITTYTTEEDSPVTLYASSGGKSISVNNILTVLARYQFSGTVKSGSSGLSGVIVGASSTGTFILTSTAAPAASIPDNSAAGLSTTIVPKGSGTISGLVVGVDITHPNIGDLRLTLKGPDGTTAILYDQSGGSQANLLASYPVLRTPVGSLSGFNGKSVQGTWTLLVQDLAAGSVGTLNSWNLTFTYGGTYTGSGTTASDGTYTVSNLKEGTYTAVPSKSGDTFTPSSRSVSVGPNVTDPNPSGVNFAKK